jgi:hypothetical protein
MFIDYQPFVVHRGGPDLQFRYLYPRPGLARPATTAGVPWPAIHGGLPWHIPPGGEAYPVTFNSVGQWTLTGYGNPGGLSGTYLRYAKIYAYNPYDPNNPRGYLYCTTNIVAAVLQ